MEQDISSKTGKKNYFFAIYLIIILIFLFIGPGVFKSDWISSSDFHACIEISSSFIALIAAYAGIVFFFGLKNRFYLVIGLGFFICGSEDLIHGILGFKRIFVDSGVDFSRFIPGTYVAGRTALALMIIAAPILEKYYKRGFNLKKEAIIFSLIAIFFGGGATAIAFALPLPQFIFPEQVISRPVDFISAILFIVAFWVIFKRFRAQNDIFTGMLLCCILLNVGGQIYMSFSKQLFDIYFDVAHWANIISYCMPVLGIALKGLEEMRAVKFEAEQRKIAQGQLKKLNENLEQKNRVTEAINEIIQKALTCETDVDVGRTCLAAAEELPSSQFGFIGEISETGRFDIIVLSNPGWDACRIPQSDATRLIKDMEIRGIWAETIKLEQSQIINELVSHPDRTGTPDGHPPLMNFLGVPLKQAGKTFGMIALANKEGGYESIDQEAMEALSLSFTEALMRKRAEMSLQNARAELIRKERLAVLGQLAGGVGHELRNPLGAIKNAVYFLNMALEKPESDVEETLEVLEKEVNTSERIISSLLDFARPKSPVRQKANVNEIVQQALSRIAPPEKIETVMKLDKTLPEILADSEQLIQIFNNIILNAVQAMSDGGRLHIKSESSDSKWLSVSIADSGQGIPAENLDNLFEPLFTTKAKGIGLGLAITKTLIEGMDGHIQVKSEPDKGSVFTIKLPIDKNEGK